MSTIEMFKGDRLPALLLTVRDKDTGVAIDLTEVDTVTLYARPYNSAEQKITAGSCDIEDAAGQVSYAWASDDTDTVGDFKGWLVLTTGGKTQNTPEFDFSVVEHAPDPAEVPSPVGAGGATTVYQGDSYLDAHGRALVYQLSLMDAPDLTGLTVTWRVENQLEVVAAVVGEDDVTVDVTSAETGALNVGTWTLELEATVATGEVVTLLRTSIQVLADIEGPS